MRRIAIAAAVMLGVMALSAGADTVKVNADGQKLRDAKRRSAMPVADLAKGQTIPVMQKDGGWIMSESGGKRGWVHEDMLKESRGGIAGAAKNVGAITGGSQEQAAIDASAGKGLGPNAIAYAGKKNYDTTGLDRLIKLREGIIDSGELAKFAREGKVGPPEYRK